MDNILTTVSPQGSADAPPATEAEVQKPDVSNTAETQAAAPESSEDKPKATEEPKKPVDIRKLKGADKVKAILKKETPKEAPKEVLKETPKEAPKETPAPTEAPKKPQTVKERFKELTTQRNEALDAARAAYEERAKAIEKLEHLQKKAASGQQLTQKEMIQEVMLEQQVDNFETQQQQDFNNRINDLTDPDSFRTNYEYYAPILNKHAEPAMTHLMKLGNYHEVLDVLFNAVNSGNIDLKTWLQKPIPVLINDINMCSKTLIEQKDKLGGSLADTVKAPTGKNPAEPPVETEYAKKDLKPSITPDLKKEQSSTVKSSKSAYEARLDKYRRPRR
jgi:hypothetical protein